MSADPIIVVHSQPGSGPCVVCGKTAETRLGVCFTCSAPDIVTRLRAVPLTETVDGHRWVKLASVEPICIEAADEIERLRAKVDDMDAMKGTR